MITSTSSDDKIGLDFMYLLGKRKLQAYFNQIFLNNGM